MPGLFYASVLAILLSFSVLDIILFFKNRKKQENIIFIPVVGHCENIEYIIRKETFKIPFSLKKTTVVCIDLGMDAETRQICDTLCKDVNFLRIIEISSK